MNINQLPPATPASFQLPPLDAQASLSLDNTSKMPNMMPNNGNSNIEQIVGQLSNLLGQLLDEIQNMPSGQCNDVKGNAAPTGFMGQVTGPESLPPDALQSLGLPPAGAASMPTAGANSLPPDALQSLGLPPMGAASMPTAGANSLPPNALQSLGLPPMGAASMPTAGGNTVSAAPASTGPDGLQPELLQNLATQIGMQQQNLPSGF